MLRPRPHEPSTATRITPGSACFARTYVSSPAAIDAVVLFPTASGSVLFIPNDGRRTEYKRRLVVVRHGANAIHHNSEPSSSQRRPRAASIDLPALRRPRHQGRHPQHPAGENPEVLLSHLPAALWRFANSSPPVLSRHDSRRRDLVQSWSDARRHESACRQACSSEGPD